MKIFYFASLRESLKLSEETLSIDDPLSVQTLKSILIKKHGPEHFKENTICAINHEVSRNSDLINNHDEVAFYPPVTGG